MTNATMPSPPSLPDGGCERIESSVVEWKRSKRGVLNHELQELWSPGEVQHGYDASGKVVAQRSPDDPTWSMVLDYRSTDVAVFWRQCSPYLPLALAVEHRGRLRPFIIWDADLLTVRSTVRYVDNELGLERVENVDRNGLCTAYIYERAPDGTPLRVLRSTAGYIEVLWPLPSKAEVARALKEVGTLAGPIVSAVRELATASAEGLCVLSFSHGDAFVPPVLAWLPTEDVDTLRSAGVDDLWMTAEWPQTDLMYLSQAEGMRWADLNTAVSRKPRAAAKAMVELARSVEAELRGSGLTCVVAALPLEVGEGHERLVKKQVSSKEWELLRAWGLVRR